MVSHYFRFTRLDGTDRRRSALLEQLLARANAPTTVEDWRMDAFRVIAAPSSPMPAAAAAALCADRGWVDAAAVLLAAPVHYVAEMSNVRLPADGVLSLQPVEADTLAGDFNRLWRGAGVRLLAGKGGELFCVFDQLIDATTHDPEEVRGRHIVGHLPQGADASRLRRLMSEMEMWMFEHAVNRSRQADGARAVSGFWLWGGGAILKELPVVNGWTAGHDPLFKALAAAPRPPLRSNCSVTPGVAVVTAEPGTDEWRDTESRWLKPSWEALRMRKISMLHLSARDRCSSVGTGWNWRRWKIPKPWWESFP